MRLVDIEREGERFLARCILFNVVNIPYRRERERVRGEVGMIFLGVVYSALHLLIGFRKFEHAPIYAISFVRVLSNYKYFMTIPDYD